METIALRQFEPLYIYLDIVFLILFASILIWKKKYATVIVGILAGILYMLVDFGIFHLVFHARSITPGYSLFWVLLWMSVSYGFTNFTWIWLWISKDKNLLEWSGLILLWWFCCPLLVQTFGGGAEPITIQRTTGAYHGYMAIFLFVGYLFLFIWNIYHEKSNEEMPILWLLAIGVLVQFGWEFSLLLGGIRSAGFTLADKLRPLIVNSLLETNLGMPYIYVIYLWYSSRFSETLRRRTGKISFMESLRENNLQSVHTFTHSKS